MKLGQQYHERLTKHFINIQFPKKVANLNFSNIKQKFQHAQNYYCCVCYFLDKMCKQNCTQSTLTSTRKPQPTMSTTTSTSLVNVHMNESEIPHYSHPNYPTLKFEDMGNLNFNRRHLYEHSVIKKMLKRIYLKCHPDKTKDRFYNFLFVKANKAYQSGRLYKLLFICQILTIQIRMSQFQKVQPIFQNEVLLLYHKAL